MHTKDSINSYLAGKTSITDLAHKKSQGLPITMLTAYDYPSAKAVDEAGFDGILVGDSLAMVVLGHPNTLAVTMEEMLHHARAVSRGAQRALLIGDLPFLSYQASPQDAVRNAGRFLKVGGMNAVKLEGGRDMAPAIRAIIAAGIPVMGHLGLTPQSVNKFGGYKVQGRTAESAAALMEDALALEDAGCFSLVLESIPANLASVISKKLTIPTIGIGAGPGCDGQILVFHDVLGLYVNLKPKFVKQYADLGSRISQSLSQLRRDMETRRYPALEHSYS